jgi:ATP-binding cassette, subfamily B, multidrug efflux pump
MRMAVVSSATSPLVTLLFGVSFTIGLIYGSRLVLDGSISLGEFVAFNGYLALIVQPVQSVARIINVLQRGAASWKRYTDVVKVVPAVRDQPETIPADRLPQASGGNLSIRDLTFTYPGSSRPALRHISLDLTPGRRVGILGKTGSGKTTLANLLVRLHEPPKGSILLDGLPIGELPLAWLRRQIAVVPQDNFLFSATLEDNIRFFDAAPDQAAVENVARLADLWDTVLSFPDGLQTIVGERGVTLSGGQKQRVSLARALLKPAPILILDDALSAVDTETEQRILATLASSTADRACLIIANRISALQDCDEILVLDDGEVSERGSHAELLAKGGFYALVAEHQSTLPKDEGGVS